MTVSSAEKRVTALIEKAGISEVPVPVEALARSLQATIAFEAYDGDVSGMLYRTADEALIGVNSSHAPTRQRFTIAHEIGHLVMHKGQEMFIDRFARVNWRNGESNREEMEANAFAAELLMPRKFVEQHVEKALASSKHVSPQSLVADLAKSFKVSPEAMSYRLSNLGILDPSALLA
jgi:Zn-dependent peptidase ImmA (M78 family)